MFIGLQIASDQTWIERRLGLCQRVKAALFEAAAEQLPLPQQCLGRRDVGICHRNVDR
jgi:hypothetical protein